MRTRLSRCSRSAVTAATSLILMCGLPAFASPQTTLVDGVLHAGGGGAAADGKYMMTFAIYGSALGGSAVWSEGPVEVAVLGGRFQHELGKAVPFPTDALAKLPTAWLGVAIDKDPELTRRPLQSVLFAMRADVADKLACSGCVTAGQIAAGSVGADKVAFSWAGSKTKGGPATEALALQCTGCVKVDHLAFDKDVDLGGNGLKAKKLTATDVAAATVSAGNFVGDGSKLSGIKIPSGACKAAGEVVKGINPDGTLQCVASMDPTGLPPDGIDEISNGLIHNQFQDEIASAAAPIGIPDNNPTGTSDTIVFPDIGLAQKLDVVVDIANSDISGLTVTVFDPDNKAYVLFEKNGKGTVLKGTWPSVNKTVSGDLSSWVGKNPKGKWRLKVADTAFKNNTTDGAIQGWSVRIQTLSTKKVQVKGDLLVDGVVKLGGSTAACTPATAGTIRWNGSHFEGCNGNKFFAIKLFVGPGTKESPAGADCAAIKAQATDALDGLYWIKPGAEPFQAWCDMTSHGGGWTLALNLDTNDGATRHYYDDAFWQGTAAVGSNAAALTSDFKSLAFSQAPAKEIMIKAHDEGAQNGTAYYAFTGTYAGKTLQWLFSNVKNATVTGTRKASAGSVGNGGHDRNAGDAFIDNNHALIFNSTWQPADANNETRIGTAYSSVCSTINCNGHNFGGLGGRHYRGGWGCYYEAAQLNGYCMTQGAYGTNGSGYKGNDAFYNASQCGGTAKRREMDFAVWVR